MLARIIVMLKMNLLDPTGALFTDQLPSVIIQKERKLLVLSNVIEKVVCCWFNIILYHEIL